MCNLSEGIAQKGIELGFQRGILQGKTEGIVIGRSEGIEIGRYEGIIEGIQKKSINILNKMIKKIYKIDLEEWLEGLTMKQLEMAEDLILDGLSYVKFIEEVEK